MIAGTGPTGVKTAGELAAAYGKEKAITLIISREGALQMSHLLTRVSQVVERVLQKLGTNLVRNTQVKGVQTSAKGEEDAGAQIIFTLSHGSTLIADSYLPLFRVQLITIFLPTSLLDSAGNLNLEQTMRVVGTKNI